MALPDAQRILPLSAEAISQIHSSKHITSLQGVVLSLLENSLDAGATKINVSVDWRRGCCTVDDNGTGIPHAEFANNGGLGKMYCTSKRAPVGSQVTETHGSNGMFIAELAAMSLLCITSSHEKFGQTASITMHQGKVLNRQMPSAGQSEDVDFIGTSVAVKDLFGNMPVRVKQRALAESDQKSDDAVWQELRRGVVGLLQAWTEPCSVRLRDVNVDSRFVTIAGNHPSVSSSLTEKSLHQLAGRRTASRYDLRDALPMLFQSGLSPNESRHRWIPLSASSSAISLKGVICLDPAPTKQCQFISIGIRPSDPLSGQTELHSAVNKTFENSSFGTAEGDVELGGVSAISKTRGAGSATRHLQGRKGIDRFPMYSLRVSITSLGSTKSLDLDQMNKASLKAITDVLTASVHAWLEKNHFRPRKRRRRRNDDEEAAETESASSSRPPSAQSGSMPNTPTRLTSHGSGAGGFLEKQPGQQHTPKRRKILDLSMRPLSRNTGPEMQAQTPLGLDHSVLSNIRMGSDRPKSNVNREVGDTPAQDQNAVTSRTSIRPPDSSHRVHHAPIAPHHGVHAETIEAGALNVRSDSPAGSNVLHTPVLASHEQVPSSEDFGSVDDAELIAAVEGSADIPNTTGVAARNEDTGHEDDTFNWTDPTSNQLFKVNARTGVVLPFSTDTYSSMAAGQEADASRQRAGIDTALSSAGKPLSLSRRRALASKWNHVTTENASGWLPGFLRDWDNPVFARQQEERIPTASLCGPGLLDLDENGRQCSHDAHGYHPLDRNALQNDGTKLSKASLEQAKVLGQVDRKFILCKLPNPDCNNDSTLVLVDQHAASERIILEDLLADLCTNTTPPQIKTSNLEHETAKAKPLHFEVSQQEVELFRQHQPDFAAWGIIYTLPPPTTNTTTPSSNILKITHLPTLIATRCSTLPSLAIDLLRSELWALADGSKKPLISLPITTSDSTTWLTLLPLMPTKLLEMLHSRACRSAIMFNDVLSQEECAGLMEKVAKCVFPFVCAHGRVGMVPVMELKGEAEAGGGFGRGMLNGDDEVMDREAICGGDALARWMMRKGRLGSMKERKY